MKQNIKSLNALCDYFDLGTINQIPKKIEGGLLHVMLKIETESGIYAVKQLSRDIDINNKHILQQYDLTEKIAAQFIQRGIPAVSSFEKSGKHLIIIDNQGFLIYPWVTATILDKDIISEEYALKIAPILAKMHRINLDVPKIGETEYAIHDDIKIINLIKKSIDLQCSFANILKQHENDILISNADYHQAIHLLKRQCVISHGDLDQKNVLWDSNNEPILIDWESARKLNPTYEIVNTSLDWSGITSHFDKSLYIKMIQSYQNAGGIIDEPSYKASFYGCLGNWINWLVYNIERSCQTDNDQQKTIGITQVTQVIPTIMRIRKLIPELINAR